MIARTSHSLTGVTVALGLLYASPLPAQEFSPYLPQTGKGAYDLYKDALLCAAVLEWEIKKVPDNEQRPRLEQGTNYARNLALHMLESGNVVDLAGAILMPRNLPVDLKKAGSDWQAVLKQEPTDTVPEVERCLRLYGHDWD